MGEGIEHIKAVIEKLGCQQVNDWISIMLAYHLLIP